MDTPYDAAVVAEWELAGRSERRQGHVHPSGRAGPAAYAASGEVAADQLCSMFADAGLDDLAGVPMLDYGCGDGRVALPMAERGAQVVGCDASRSMLVALRRRAPAVRGIPTSELDGSGPFAAAYCLAVLIHQRWAMAAEIVRSVAAELEPGSPLVIDAPCYELDSEGGSAFAVTTFGPERLTSMVEGAGCELLRELRVNPGRFGGEPGPEHGAWVLARRC